MQTQSGILSADYKAVGGKLLRVRMTVSVPVSGSGTPPLIQTIRITGDFFMHPEEAIEDLERLLIGAPLDESTLRERVQGFFDGDVQVVGADVDDFVAVLLKAS